MIRFGERRPSSETARQMPYAGGGREHPRSLHPRPGASPLGTPIRCSGVYLCRSSPARRAAGYAGTLHPGEGLAPLRTPIRCGGAANVWHACLRAEWSRQWRMYVSA
jgi:hypothetical protein